MILECGVGLACLDLYRSSTELAWCPGPGLGPGPGGKGKGRNLAAPALCGGLGRWELLDPHRHDDIAVVPVEGL